MAVVLIYYTYFYRPYLCLFNDVYAILIARDFRNYEFKIDISIYFLNIDISVTLYIIELKLSVGLKVLLQGSMAQLSYLGSS